MKIEQWEDHRGIRPVEDFIVGQPSKAQAKIAWTIGLLENQGTNLLRTDHMTILHGYKPSLYELRVRTMGKFYRILFVILDNTAWFVHGFIKQTDKTPRKHINIAIKRAEELMSKV